MSNIMSWPGAHFGKGIFETALGYYTGGATGAALAANAAIHSSSGQPTINVPPPPGAAMIDPSGQAAASAQRRSAAAAGGLQSTISPGASASTGSTGATSGGKSALGQ